jgi:hypothetical protein
MKSIVLYNGYELIHDRNPFGSHSWLLKDAEKNILCQGNVAVASRLINLWPHDDVVAAIVETMYIGNAYVASYGWSLGDQHRLLSVGKRCRHLQELTGLVGLNTAYYKIKNPHCGRGLRALEHRRRRRLNN